MTTIAVALVLVGCGRPAAAPTEAAPTEAAPDPAPEGPVEVRVDSVQDLPSALAAWQAAAASGGTVAIVLGSGPFAGGSLSLHDPFLAAAQLPVVEVRGGGARWSGGSLVVTGAEVRVTGLVVEDAPVRLEATERIVLDRVAVLASRAPERRGAHAAGGLELVARGPGARVAATGCVLASVDHGALDVRTQGAFADVTLRDSVIAGQVRGPGAATLASGRVRGAAGGFTLGDAVERAPWVVGGPTPWAEAARRLEVDAIR